MASQRSVEPAAGMSRPRREAVARYRRRGLSDTTVTWLPPVSAGVASVLVYFAAYFDWIDTRLALAVATTLVAATVLYFPMRYSYRLPADVRWSCIPFALLWMFAVAYPPLQRCFPGQRLASSEVSPDKVPVLLELQPPSSRVDLVVECRMEASNPGAARVAEAMVTVEADQTLPKTFTAEFRESWTRQRQGRSSSVELHEERKESWFVLDNPARGNLRVTSLTVKGNAPSKIFVSAFPHRLLPWWVTLPLAGLLAYGALRFDRETGANQTAASMTIATAAALMGGNVFPYVGSPYPTFRELIGSVIVAALVGGPIGGLLVWLFGQGSSRQSRWRRRRR